MKVLIVYDSVFGNTATIAGIIGKSFQETDECLIVKVNEFKPEQMSSLDILIVGSPTRAFKATPEISRFLARIPANALKSTKVAAFDTRMSVKEINNKFLTFMVKIFGYAAEPIASRLQKKGGTLLLSPEGFIVMNSEGPLKENEEDRAALWANTIRQIAEKSE